MNESITVIDKNGNSIVAEGIACIQFVSSGRKYILYTLNEKVENDLTKMYVGEIGSTVGEKDKIEDEEWLHIKTTLNGISHGETNPDLKYINMNSIPLNIGVPKKLAIKPDVKQAFSDRYNMAVITDSQSILPNGTPQAQGTTSFFNNDVVGDNTPANDGPAVPVPDTSGSIFANPMQPDLTQSTITPPSPVQASAPVEATTEANPVMQASPVANVIETSPVAPQVVQPVASIPEAATPTQPVGQPAPQVVQPMAPAVAPIPVANPVAEDLSQKVMENVNNAPVQETMEESPEPVTLEQMMPANQVKGIGFHVVTREEALQALDVINRYINQNGGDFNGLAIGDNTEITMDAEEVTVPNHQVEDNSNEEPVVPTSELSATQESTIPSIVAPGAAPIPVAPVTEAVPQNVKMQLAPATNVIEAAPIAPQVVETVPATSEVIETTPIAPEVMQAAPSASEVIPTAPSAPEVIQTIPTSPEVVPTTQAPDPAPDSTPTTLDLPINTPEMIPTIDLNNQTQPQTPPPVENNFVSMGVNDINNMVATPEPTTGDALQVTGTENLINLDAITSIPEIDPVPTATPTALTNQPISNAYVNSDPSGIPVTLPNNYNSQGNSNTSVLGPGSLPTDNN